MRIYEQHALPAGTNLVAFLLEKRIDDCWLDTVGGAIPISGELRVRQEDFVAEIVHRLAMIVELDIVEVDHDRHPRDARGPGDAEDRPRLCDDHVRLHGARDVGNALPSEP